jgi:hypothetical protein
MPTKLTRNVTREVLSRRGTEVVLTLTQEGVVVREKGRRKRFGPLDYGSLLLEVIRRTLEQERRERDRSRKTKRRRK